MALFHSFIVFIITYVVFERGILEEDGYNTDLWGFSVCMFFSIIVIVTAKLCISERLFNIFSILSLTAFSVMLYYIYNWVSNYLTFSKTYLTAEQLHVTPIFYLTILLCAGIALVVDLAIETIKIEFLGLPSEYMRTMLNKHKELPDEFYPEFERLMEKQQLKFVDQDQKREEYVVKRRETRMEKLQKKIENDRV